MNPRLRNACLIALAVVIAVMAGVGLADGSFLLSSIVAFALFWIVAEWSGRAWPEALVLGVVLAGYILGNRGFAQFSLSTQLPLLPAEVALLVGVPALVVRAAFRQTAAVRRDALNFAILAWMIVAAARLPLDWREFHVMALRDFAMVYYAAFFFLGQALARHEGSRGWLRGCLTFAFLLLPPLAFAVQRAPDFFFRYTTVRGAPLIYHKSDLIASYLAAGFVWCWWRWEKGGGRAWLMVAAASFALIATMASPRAAMLGLAVATLLWLLARRWRIVAFQGAVVVVGAAAALPVLLIFQKDIKETPLYSAYEHGVSIFDFEGKRTYWNRDSGDPGDNNRFRLVWWHAVARETLETNPAFGLGFGYDLAARFLADYDWIAVEDFGARSPHSMVMTVFGRMGFVGLACWLTIAGVMARRTLIVFRQKHLLAMGWWSVAWVVWTSACFGVVLEGPMGAVLFWTVLGVANTAYHEALAAAGPEADATNDAPHLRRVAPADELAPAP